MMDANVSFEPQYAFRTLRRATRFWVGAKRLRPVCHASVRKCGHVALLSTVPVTRSAEIFIAKLSLSVCRVGSPRGRNQKQMSSRTGPTPQIEIWLLVFPYLPLKSRVSLTFGPGRALAEIRLILVTGTSY